MNLKIFSYMNNLLKNAEYKYDPSVKQWAGWIKEFPGIYAQGESIEDVRLELISVLEEFLLIELQENLKRLKSEKHAKANKTARVSA